MTTTAQPAPSAIYNGLDGIIQDVATALIHDDIWYAFAKQTEEDEQDFIPILVKLFNKQLADVRKRMLQRPPPWIVRTPESDAYIEGIFVPGEWRAEFEAASFPFLEAVLEEAGNKAMVSIELGADFDVTTARIQALIQSKVEKFTFEVNETTLAQFKTSMSQAVENGENMRQIRNRVKDVFDIVDNRRALTIARTEVIGTTNRGTLEGYRESGIVDTKVWIATRDNLTRDSHSYANGVGGEEVALEVPFSNGLMHPGDWQGPAKEVVN